MGKQNNNFEYYKPQNGSSLIPSDSESDNSDAQAMFQLPKRKIIRSKGSSFAQSKRRGKFCQICCGSIAPLVISIFIIGTLTSIGYILLGVNGMKRELELLKIKMNKVQSEEKSNLKDNKILQHKMEEQLISFNKNNKINRLNVKVNLLSAQVKALNETVIKLQARSGSTKETSSSTSSVAQDVTLLKKGMADTGGEIKKLTDDAIEAKKTIKLLTDIVKGMKNKYMNLSQIVAKISRHPLPTESVDTLEPLMSTSIPPIKSTDNTESMAKVSKLLKKLLTGYNNLFKNKTAHLKLELIKMDMKVSKLNLTHGNMIKRLEQNLTKLSNDASHTEEMLKELRRKVQSYSASTKNSTSGNKILGVVKDILLGLKKHQALISNLTTRVERMDNNLQNGNNNLPATSKPSGKMSSSKMLVTQMPITHHISVAEDENTMTRAPRFSKIQNRTLQQEATTVSPHSFKASASSSAMEKLNETSSPRGNHSVAITRSNSTQIVHSTEPTRMNGTIIYPTKSAPSDALILGAKNAIAIENKKSSDSEETRTHSKGIELKNEKKERIKMLLNSLRNKQKSSGRRRRPMHENDEEDDGLVKEHDMDNVPGYENTPKWDRDMERDGSLQNPKELDDLDESA